MFIMRRYQTSKRFCFSVRVLLMVWLLCAGAVCVAEVPVQTLAGLAAQAGKGAASRRAGGNSKEPSGGPIPPAVV